MKEMSKTSKKVPPSSFMILARHAGGRQGWEVIISKRKTKLIKW